MVLVNHLMRSEVETEHRRPHAIVRLRLLKNLIDVLNHTNRCKSCRSSLSQIELDLDIENHTLQIERAEQLHAPTVSKHALN